jgi:AcrR family transcriptional regulator
MNNSGSPPPRPRGRPRGFDREAALDTAMRLFWTRGYEATSVSDLAAAMGINPPSLYAAFGDKRRLFEAAVARYEAGPGGYGRPALADPALSTAEAVRALLEGAAIAFTRPGEPAGCMVVLAATACGPAAAPVAADLAARRAATEAAIRARIARGIAAGDLPAGTDAAAVAGLVAATLYGLTVKARDGTTPEDLRGVVAAFMRGWPAG